MEKSLPRLNRIINRLWRYRKTQQLSQKEVALLLGHKKSTQVSRWENGEKLPTLKNALMLGSILKAPVEELFPDLVAALHANVQARAAKRENLNRKQQHANEETKAKAQ